MQFCDHLKRRSLDRSGTWILAVTLVCLLTALVITLKIRYAEASRQDRIKTYLNEMTALHPRMGKIEESVYKDIDEMGKLHQLLGTTETHFQEMPSAEANHGSMQGKLDIAKAADSTVDKQYSDG